MPTAYTPTTVTQANIVANQGVEVELPITAAGLIDFGGLAARADVAAVVVHNPISSACSKTWTP